MLGAAQSSKVDKPDRTPASIDLSADDDGRSMHRLVSELYPDLTHGSQPLADIAPDAGVDHGNAPILLRIAEDLDLVAQT